MTRVFVNYRSADEAYLAILLDEKLCERLGSDNVFRDERSIGLGVDFNPVLWANLARSSVLVVVIGKNWFATDAHGRRRLDDPADFVRREIALGLQLGIRVIPVLVGDVPPLRAADLPPDVAPLADRQFLRLGTRAAQHDVARLVDEIARIVDADDTAGTRPEATRGAPVPPAPVAAEPWRGTVVMVQLEQLDLARTAEQRVVLRAELTDMVGKAAVEARLDDAEITERHSGLLVRVGDAVPPVRTVAEFAVTLNKLLLSHGRGLRAKVAVARGAVDARDGMGDAVDEVSRLVSLPLLDGVLKRAGSARLALVVPDEFFDGVVRAERRFVDPSTFASAADGDCRCWLHVPGYSAPPGMPATPRPEPADHRSGTGTQIHAESGPTQVHTGSGPQININGWTQGDMHLGDHVEGDKFQFGSGNGAA